MEHTRFMQLVHHGGLGGERPPIFHRAVQRIQQSSKFAAFDTDLATVIQTVLLNYTVVLDGAIDRIPFLQSTLG
jgi:hypothetical protein